LATLLKTEGFYAYPASHSDDFSYFFVGLVVGPWLRAKEMNPGSKSGQVLVKSRFHNGLFVCTVCYRR